MANHGKQDLHEFVEDLMEQTGVPGVAIGILHRGETHTAGLGVTNVDHPLAVTDETLFQIGSITKTVTGTAVLRLVEEGELDLDTTIQTYLPNFKVADEAVSKQATIRHLLTHMGGWVGDFFIDTGSSEDASARYVAKMKNLEQLAPLGSVWSYNNSGFYLAGHLLETVTGKSAQDFLRELVLEPLGMDHAFFDPGDVLTHRFAVGHFIGENGTEVARPWALPRAVYSVGGIVCHVKDLLRYAGFHLGDGTSAENVRLLEEETLSQMHTPHASIWGDRETMGLTWFINDTTDVRQLFHGGGTTGQISLLTLIPEHDFAVAVLTNANQGGVLTRKVSQWAIKQYLNIDSRDPTPMKTTVDELKPFAGRYERPFADVELELDQDRLLATLTFKQGFPTQDTPPPPSPPPMTCTLCEPDRLVILDSVYKDTTAEVIRKSDGSIGWLRLGARIHKRKLA